MKRIYLDNSATTKPDKAVILAMNEVLEKYWGNASSLHAFGLKAREILDSAREITAFNLDCRSEEIIFTSGGSESNNLAIKGVIEALKIKFQYLGNDNQANSDGRNQFCKPHIITSAIEHHSVLDTVKEMEKAGLIEASYIKPAQNGVIRVEDIEAEIRDNTVLVSIIYVNNEIGTVQPISEIGKAISEINSKRQGTTTKQISNSDSHFLIIKGNNKLKSNNLQAFDKIYFHTDAVQAMEYFQTGVKYLGVDLLTFSAHKFYGPKGVGALYVKKDTPLNRQISGGNQENNFRAGTENIAGIAGLSTALVNMHKSKADSKIGEPNKLLPELIVYNETKRLNKLRNKLIKGLLKIPETKINGCLRRRSPNNVNVSFKNAEGESILILLNKEGIAASSGSACTSGSLEPSHVLTAIGVSAEWSHGSIRFSLGKHNTEEEIDKVLKVLPPIIDRLRKMSPYSK